MTNETRTPSLGGARETFCGSPLCYMVRTHIHGGPGCRFEQAPADHCGIVEVDPADFTRIDAQGLMMRVAATVTNLENGWKVSGTCKLLCELTDLIEQLLAERADAVQAGEKIGRARGRRFARKVSQRHAKHGARL